MSDLTKEKIKYLLALIINISMIVVFSFIPNLGYIKYNYLTISIVSIVVIISGINNGYFAGVICGLTLGICSYFVSTDYNMNPSDAIYQNIFIAIIPKVFLGITATFFYQLLVNIFKIKWISSMIGTLISLAIEVVITFLMAFLLEGHILMDIYNERNVMYLFFQYVQFATLIETAIITLVVGIVMIIIEYVFKSKIND